METAGGSWYTRPEMTQRSRPEAKTQGGDRIVLHVAGPDRPGVTATLTSILAEEHARLVTIGQSVLHGYLMLSAVVEMPPSSRVLRRILFAVAELGLRLEVSPLVDHEQSSDSGPALCVTLLGDLSGGREAAAVTRFLADRELNIVEIRTLSVAERLTGMELIAALPADPPLSDDRLRGLRGDILGLSDRLEVDMAIQRDDIFRRSKRLVCLDVDSTFARGEFIDELASLAGCGEQVAEVTARAMRGELEFKQALRERVKLLAGLPIARARELVDQVKLTPGAYELARTLKSLGFRVGLVSGGFDFFVDVLRTRYGLDFGFANELEVSDGKITGEVRGTIVDGERKAQILRDMCKVYKCRIEQSVAIGDGANDRLMLQAAGLGIAFHGKPALREVADMSLSHSERIDTLLFLMGFSARDLRDL